MRLRLNPIALALVLLVAAAPSVAVAQGAAWSQFRGPNGTGIAETTGLPVEFSPDDGSGLEDPAASRPLVAGAHRHARLRHRAHRREGHLHALGDWPRSQDRQGPVAERGPAPAEGPAAERQRPRVAEPRHGRRERLRVLPGLRPHRVFGGRHGTLAPAPRPLRPVLRLRRVAHPRRRPAHPPGRSGLGFVPARRGQADRQGALEGRTPGCHLGLLDAHGVRAAGRTEAGHRSRVVPVVVVLGRGRLAGVVGARPAVRDEVRREL